MITIPARRFITIRREASIIGALKIVGIMAGIYRTTTISTENIISQSTRRIANRGERILRQRR